MTRVLILAFLGLAGCAKGSATPQGGPGADLAVAVPEGGVADDLAVADLAGGDALTFAQRCFPAVFTGHPNYDQFNPKYPLTHCSGTNQQDITGVQKVVFLGDSVTVGTPPIATADYYR